MGDQSQNNRTQTSGEDLAPKDATVFKNMMEFYNFKNYKKALKLAESLLSKYPNHGETLSVKALLLLFLEPSKEEEIMELAKRGLRNGINSYLCWHVLGVIYKQVKKYKETVKCFIMSLKLDPHNDRLIKEICCLQIELNDYAGFRKFAITQLNLRPKEYREWMMFALSQHLCGNLKIASEILEEADSLFKPNYKVEELELSEAIMYRAMLYEQTGEFEKCVRLLEEKEELLKDKMSYMELKGKALYLGGKQEKANATYKELIELNGNNARFIFMYFLTHKEEKIRKLFTLPFQEYTKTEVGTIYEEKLKKNSKEFIEGRLDLKEDGEHAFVLSNEVLDIDGEYSSAGWNLENKLYHNFDMYIRAKNKENKYQNCYSYPEYCMKSVKKMNLKELPNPDTLENIEEVMSVLEEYMKDKEEGDLVNYVKYKKHLKRDRYQLFMTTRKLKEEEEKELLLALEELELKDYFMQNCFQFLFSSGVNFYYKAQKYIISGLDRGSTNMMKAFEHCLTFRKGYMLMFLLSKYNEKLIRRERIDDCKKEEKSKKGEHEVSCNYRIILVKICLSKVNDFMGNYEKALKIIEEGFKVAPTSVDLMCERGKIRKHIGDYKGSKEDYGKATEVDKSDRQTNAKSAKAIVRAGEFEEGVKRWKSFLVEDVCVKNEKEPPPEIPSFKFELMIAKGKYDRYLKMALENKEEESNESLKEALEKYKSILEKHDEMYKNQLDFHNYCINRLSYRIYHNFLKLKNNHCAQGYFIKALKGAIKCTMEMCEREMESERKNKNENIEYCVEWMKVVMSQRVYDTGLYEMFYKIACMSEMNTLFKVQCITRCYYAGGCNKMNDHLIKMVFDFLYKADKFSEVEKEVVKKTIKLVVEEELALKYEEENQEFAGRYLNYQMIEILKEENYEFKKVQAVVMCAYNCEKKEFLEKVFENSRELYRDITFKDYLKFKRFLKYAVNSCFDDQNKEVLRKELEKLDKECSSEFIIER